MNTNEIAEKLDEITGEIFYEFGTKSYEIRCKLYDLINEVKKLNTSLVGVSEAEVFEPPMIIECTKDGFKYVIEGKIISCSKTEL